MSARPVFDFHTDLLSRLLEEPLEGFATGRPQSGFVARHPELNFGHYDLPRMRAGGVRAVVWALYTEDGRGEDPVVRTLRMIDIAETLAARHGDAIALARTAADVERANAAGKVAAILSIENGIACLDRIELLRTYWRLGVRAMGLVWNGRNAIADGCGEEAAGGKLTAFGGAVVEEMKRLGMLVDVSHLSRAGFWDVAERMGGRPFIASHSNARALCDHRRNLDDEQIRALARSGGVVGVNFWSGFLNGWSKMGDPAATLDDVVRHVEGLVERAGIDHVGIGADYDGIGIAPVGLEDPSRFPVLAEALERRGFGAADLERIFFANFLRVFREVCG
jgi:membrane dipeptidase